MLQRFPYVASFAMLGQQEGQADTHVMSLDFWPPEL